MTAPDPTSRLRWDLFCRIVDNFGDIGVCWRLARDLAANHEVAPRLWVDDPATFLRLCPQASRSGDAWFAEGVVVRPWQDPFPAVEPAPVVIEAFACEPPGAYVAAMAKRSPAPLWINLEYLSAEDWVPGCHRLASPHPRLPLTKRFFFPGFVAGTGGLLREPGLLAGRDRFRADGVARASLLGELEVGPMVEGARLVSLFAYEQPGLEGLMGAWAEGREPIHLLVPEGRVVPEVARFFGTATAGPGARFARGALAATILPFVDQDRYDRLLWACDLNFVRGEDSFVRAQWAAGPFVWHIYPQQADAHLPKLEAFLDRYLSGLDDAPAEALRAFWQAWNGHGEPAAAWPAFAAALPALADHGRRWSDTLARMEDLATALVHFCRG